MRRPAAAQPGTERCACVAPDAVRSPWDVRRWAGPERWQRTRAHSGISKWSRLRADLLHLGEVKRIAIGIVEERQQQKTVVVDDAARERRASGRQLFDRLLDGRVEVDAQRDRSLAPGRHLAGRGMQPDGEPRTAVDRRPVVAVALLEREPDRFRVELHRAIHVADVDRDDSASKHSASLRLLWACVAAGTTVTLNRGRRGHSPREAGAGKSGFGRTPGPSPSLVAPAW